MSERDPYGQEIELEPIDRRYPALDWHAAYANRRDGDTSWLIDPLFERGRTYVVYSPAKIGKSLLLQDVGARASLGVSVLGRPPRGPLRVLYLDDENAQHDVVERMTDYGYGPADLGNLIYLSFAGLPALNTPPGARALCELAEHHKADMVVLDTVSRMVTGKENASDTMHDLARLAMTPLKRVGVTVVRLDHSGKDPRRGMRGTSAKATDVDVVWRLAESGPDAFEMRREEARNAHHPDSVRLRRDYEPLRHVIVGEGVSAEASRVAAILDRLGADPGMGRERARAFLASHNVRAGSNGTLSAALRCRQARS